MKALSQSLEELAARVKVLEDSATATFEADRAKLEQRRSGAAAGVRWTPPPVAASTSATALPRPPITLCSSTVRMASVSAAAARIASSS